MAKWFGFGPPFVGGVRGVMSRQEDERLIKNDILSLLRTSPGERIYRPGFGVNLNDFVFELEDESALDALRSHIVEQITLNEERVRVVSVDVTGDGDSNSVMVSIVVRPVFDPKSTYVINSKLNRGS